MVVIPSPVHVFIVISLWVLRVALRCSVVCVVWCPTVCPWLVIISIVILILVGGSCPHSIIPVVRVLPLSVVATIGAMPVLVVVSVAMSLIVPWHPVVVVMVSAASVLGVNRVGINVVRSPMATLVNMLQDGNSSSSCWHRWYVVMVWGVRLGCGRHTSSVYHLALFTCHGYQSPSLGSHRYSLRTCCGRFSCCHSC